MEGTGNHLTVCGASIVTVPCVTCLQEGREGEGGGAGVWRTFDSQGVNGHYLCLGLCASIDTDTVCQVEPHVHWKHVDLPAWSLNRMSKICCDILCLALLLLM